jgi:hypothetical protein
MSYEGHTQYVCEKGHYDTSDCYDELDKCKVCGAKFAWTNSVDETNGDPWPWNGEVRLQPKTHFEKCTCTCGNVHSKPGSMDIYDIPTPDLPDEFFTKIDMSEDWSQKQRFAFRVAEARKLAKASFAIAEFDHEFLAMEKFNSMSPWEICVKIGIAKVDG